MTLEEEKRYLLLLASYCCGAKHQPSSCERVLDCIEKNNWAIFSANELQSVQEVSAWKGEAGALGARLVEEKIFQSGVEGDWSLSELGKRELVRLHQGVGASFPVKVSYPAIEYAESVFPFA